MIAANCSCARFSVCGGVGSGAIEGSGHCCAYSFKRLLSSNSYYTGQVQKQICSYIAVCEGRCGSYSTNNQQGIDKQMVSRCQKGCRFV